MVGSQGPFDVVGVFDGVVENLIDRAVQRSTNNDNSVQLVRFVKVASIMFAEDPSLRDSVHGCVGR